MSTVIQGCDRLKKPDSLMRRTKGVVRKVVRSIGYDVVPYSSSDEFPPDFTEQHRSIVRKVMPYTMTSPERLYALIEAVHHVVKTGIPGSILECGVWRGGSMLAAALTLEQMNCSDRELYLFDTFEGMPKPKMVDKTYDGTKADTIFQSLSTGDDSSAYCRASLTEVRETLSKSQYPKQNVHFVKGKVESTIPHEAPSSIAVLRLDTDWYESTKHELEHLFPRLSRGGVLLIDDYGHWQGCKRAVDEYFAIYQHPFFLSRIDYTGRIGIKTI
jgi:hypothetical protein